MGEWLKPAVLKTVRPERVSWVRIPPPPPSSRPYWLLHCIELNKGQIYGEIHTDLCRTGPRRIGFPPIRLNQTEFSPGVVSRSGFIAAQKAAGLADFTRKLVAAFGRIEMIRIVKGKIERLRLHQESVRNEVLKVTVLKHLAELYARHG